MFDPHISTPTRSVFDGNWEKDVNKVELEACEFSEDPLGLRAVFYLGRERPLTQKTNYYKVGASHLRERLSGIRRSGYDAPMTCKAIEMIEERMEREGAYWDTHKTA